MTNVTNWSNITDFGSLLGEANRFTEFWTGVLFMIWAVFVITFLPFGSSVALIGGSFMALIIGILLVYMDLVAWKWVIMIGGTIFITIILDTLFSKKET